MEKIISVEWK